jgi:hypothetical protein
MRWTRRDMSVAFCTWKTDLQKKKRGEVICSRLMKKWFNRTLMLAFNTWNKNADLFQYQETTLCKIALRWTNRALAAAFTTWSHMARKKTRMRAMEEAVLSRCVKTDVGCAFDSWLFWTCLEQRSREIESNNLVNTYMSEKEAKWESESSLLRAAVDEMTEEVETLHSEFATAHMMTVRRAQDLLKREQFKAQQRLQEAALELERVRAELEQHQNKKHRSSDAEGAKSRRHMAFF